MRQQAAKQSSICNTKKKDYKKYIVRQERRKAKLDPECIETYKLYLGYIS